MTTSTNTTLQPRDSTTESFVVDSGLAYIPGNSVVVTHVNNPLVNNFEARVSSYNIYNGAIVLDNIVNINGFESDIASTFNINLMVLMVQLVLLVQLVILVLLVLLVYLVIYI